MEKEFIRFDDETFTLKQLREELEEFTVSIPMPTSTWTGTRRPSSSGGGYGDVTVRRLTAVLYARVSTDDKGRTNETQICEMRKWCEREGVKVLEIFQDKQSGKDLDCPQFLQAVGRIATGDVNILLALDVTRLTRNNQLGEVRKMIEPFRTQIRFVMDPLDPDSVGGRITTAVEEAFGAEERRVLGIKTSQGMRTRQLQGIHIGRPLAMVFTHRVEENRACIKTDGKQQTKIVSLKAVMELASEGYSLAKAAKVLGVSKIALAANLVSEGEKEEFLEICGKAKNSGTKGGTTERVGNTEENRTERGSD